MFYTLGVLIAIIYGWLAGAVILDDSIQGPMRLFGSIVFICTALWAVWAMLKDMQKNVEDT